MKSLIEKTIDQIDLDEGLVRKSAISSFGAQSRRYGDEAVREFKRGQEVLKRGSQEQTAEDRLERIENALIALFDGLTKQRQQIGAGVAVDVTGHMLAMDAGKKR